MRAVSARHAPDAGTPSASLVLQVDNVNERAERLRLEQVVLQLQAQLKKLESRCDRLAETKVPLNKRLQQLEGAAHRDREPYRESGLDDPSERAALAIAQRLVEAVPGVRWDGLQEAAGQRYAALTDVETGSTGWLLMTELTVANVRAWAAEARRKFAR
jgi:hypothetical protein